MNNDLTLADSIRQVLNRECRENASGTPDHILACYLLDSLKAFERAVRDRDQWWGHKPMIGGTVPAVEEEAGVEWDTEPTPEPTGDLSKVRVIDAEGDTWKKWEANDWVCIVDGFTKPWSEVPQPATVLRPEGGRP